MRFWVVVGVLLATLIAAAPGMSGASVPVVVSMTIPSTITLNVDGCAAGTPATTFGQLTPGTTDLVTGCSIAFGSNGDAMLRMRQRDGTGDAMSSPTTGALDTTGSFTAGSGGVTTAAARNGDQIQVGGIALQPSGRILQAGYDDSNGDGLVVGYAPDGSLDPAWGTPAGFRFVDFGTNTDIITGMRVQGDGKVVVVGSRASGDLTTYNTVIARLDATNGALDTTTFGTGGITTIPVEASRYDAASDLEILPDGSIIVAGLYDTGSNYESYLLKLTGGGVLDPDFGDGGIVRNPGGMDLGDHVNDTASVRVQSSGRILLQQGTNGTGQVAAFTPTGELDTAGWGTAGRRTINDAGWSNWLSFDIDPSDRALVGSDRSSGTVKVRRLTATNGANDNSFGTSGVVTLAPPGGTNTWADAGIVTDAIGNIYIVGDGTFSGQSRMWVARLRETDGSLDPNFGTSGFRIINYGGGTPIESHHTGVALQDGNLLIGGYLQNGGAAGDDFALARLVGGATFTDYGGSALWTSDDEQSMFGVCLETTTNATAEWSEAPGAGACTTADAAHWRGIPRSSDTTSLVATTASPDATVELTFGAKAATNQPRGTYHAGIVIEVVAPVA